MSRTLDFPVFDADNHMYETTDAFTKYLPKEYDGLVKYVQVNGRTKIALRNQISEYIPNPTFNKVAPPGAQELEFKLKNPNSKVKPPKEGDKVVAAPPRYIDGLPGYFNPADRLVMMDELSIDRAMMWPTLASLLEERLTDDLEATSAVATALNDWMHEHWTFNFEDRIFATPVVTLGILDDAVRELDRVVERGARAILIRPTPVPTASGGRRSFALPEFDPFWQRVQESGVLVGMHSSDDGSQRYMNDWEGSKKEFLPFGGGQSAFFLMVQHQWRTISDVITSIIGHGLATRFPDIRFMPVENGSSWVRPLVHSFEDHYERYPALFDEDPMDTWRRSIYVHPFHEENVHGLVDVLGAKNVVFGSDYPHPEGMFDPVTFVDELEELPLESQKDIMGANLARVMGIDPELKAL